jgi:hypothetical protein
MKKFIAVVGATIALAACGSSVGNTPSSGTGGTGSTSAMPNPPANVQPMSYGHTTVYVWCVNDSYTDQNGNFNPSAEVYVKNTGRYSAQVAIINFEIFSSAGTMLPGYDGSNSQDGLSPDNNGVPWTEVAPGTTRLFSQGGGAAVKFTTCKAFVSNN